MSGPAVQTFAVFGVDELLAVAPYMRGALRADGTFDPALVSRQADAQFLAIVTAMQELGERLAGAEIPQDEAALGRIGADVERIMGGMERLSFFVNLCIARIRPGEQQSLYDHALPEEIAALERQVPIYLSEQLTRHVDGYVARYPEQSEACAPLRQWAAALRRQPASVQDRAGQQRIADAVSLFYDVLHGERWEAEAVADAFAAVVQYQTAMAAPEQAPYDDFLRRSGITRAQLRELAAYRCEPEALPELLALIDRHPVTWEDARRNVTGLFARLHPELGAIAARAFEENWIWARSGDYSDARTFQGISSRDGGHPFMSMVYQGHMQGVSTLAHEMAHVAGYCLAGGNDAASGMLHETFALFFEAALLLEQARTHPDREAEFTLFAHAVLEKNMSLVELADFELALYDLARQRPVTAEDCMAATARFAATRDIPASMARHGLRIMELGPMECFSYAMASCAAGALLEVWKRDPAAAGEALVAVMRRGGGISPDEALRTLAPGCEGLSRPWAEEQGAIRQQHIRNAQARMAALPEHWQRVVRAVLHDELGKVLDAHSDITLDAAQALAAPAIEKRLAVFRPRTAAERVAVQRSQPPQVGGPG